MTKDCHVTTYSGNLRLTEPKNAAPLPGTNGDRKSRPNRRQTPRIPITGTATTVCHESDCFKLGKNLVLVDYADGGIGAIHDSPLSPGDAICLQLPWDPGQLRKGRIVRCSPRHEADGGGYFIAIQFPMKQAA